MATAAWNGSIPSFTKSDFTPSTDRVRFKNCWNTSLSVGVSPRSSSGSPSGLSFILSCVTARNNWTQYNMFSSIWYKVIHVKRDLMFTLFDIVRWTSWTRRLHSPDVSFHPNRLLPVRKFCQFCWQQISIYFLALFQEAKQEALDVILVLFHAPNHAKNSWYGDWYWYGVLELEPRRPRANFKLKHVLRSLTFSICLRLKPVSRAASQPALFKSGKNVKIKSRNGTFIQQMVAIFIEIRNK